MARLAWWRREMARGMSEPIRWEADCVTFADGEIEALLRRAADWLVAHPGFFVKAMSAVRDDFGDRIELYGWEK